MRRTIYSFLFSFLLLVAHGGTTSAQTLGPGSWLGILQIGNGLRILIVFDFHRDASGNVAGTWSSPEQSSLPLEIPAIRETRDSVFLAFKPLPASYEGMFLNDNTLEGVFVEGGSAIPMRMVRAFTYEATIPDTSGLIAGGKERVAIKIAKDRGTWLGTFERIDRDGEQARIDSLQFVDDHLTGTIRKLDLSLDGMLIKQRFELQLVQKGQSVHAAFQLVPALPEPLRPQTPKPPFPYKQIDVQYRGGAPTVTMSGTLTIPNGKGPFPAVFLITGSGPQDRDETLMGHQPYRVIADHLSRHGIAVLRTDDRGVGKSTGTFNTATSADFALDAKAAIEFLRTRPEIDQKHLGLIGHSEGGMIAPMIAAQDTHSYSDPSHVNFLVLLAGPGVPITQLMAQQRRDLAIEDTNQHDLDGLKYLSLMDQEVLAGDRATLSHRLDSIWKMFYKSQGGDTASNESQRQAMQMKMSTFQFMLAPWYAWFIAYDPAQVLRKVHQPVLAMNGTLDRQVAAEPNLSGIETALAEGGNKDTKIVRLKGLNHLFQHAHSGLGDEYAIISETFSPEALDIMTAWIKTHTKSARQ